MKIVKEDHDSISITELTPKEVAYIMAMLVFGEGEMITRSASRELGLTLRDALVVAAQDSGAGDMPEVDQINRLQ